MPMWTALKKWLEAEGYITITMKFSTLLFIVGAITSLIFWAALSVYFIYNPSSSYEPGYFGSDIKYGLYDFTNSDVTYEDRSALVALVDELQTLPIKSLIIAKI